VERPPTGIVTT